MEPPIRIERTTYGLRNRDQTFVVPDTYVDLRPLRGRILALLEAYAAKRRPLDRELVGVLGEVYALIEDLHLHANKPLKAKNFGIVGEP